MQKRGFDGAKGRSLFRTPSSITTISPGSTSRMNSAPMMSSAQVSDESTQPSPEPPEDERADAERVADADELRAGHGDDGEGAFDAAERVLHPLGDGPLDRAGHQVDDALGVRGGLEDRAAVDELAPQRVGVGDVAVVGDGGAAHRELAEERLHVADLGRALGAGGRVADVADGERARQRLDHRVGGEVVADVAEAAGGVEALLGVVGDDAARLLPAVLERVEAEGHEARRFLDADHAEDAAFLVELVVVRGRQRRSRRGGLGQVAHGVRRPESVPRQLCLT